MAIVMDWEPDGLLRTFSGRVSGDEILRSNLLLQGDARFDSLEYVINDFSAVTDVELTEQDLKAISQIDRAASLSNPRFRIAIVVPQESLRIWAEKYSFLMKDSVLMNQIFSTVEDARSWIERDS